LRLLDETAEDNGEALVKAKHHPGLTVVQYLSPHFPKTFADRLADRHSDRPLFLNTLEIGPDRLSILSSK
jgi:hypothetical protein